MPAPDRADILRRARKEYLDNGRGFIVVTEGRDVPHYGFLDELQRSLTDEEEAVGIVKAAEDAVAPYNPKREADVEHQERRNVVRFPSVGPQTGGRRRR